MILALKKIGKKLTKISRKNDKNCQVTSQPGLVVNFSYIVIFKITN